MRRAASRPMLYLSGFVLLAAVWQMIDLSLPEPARTNLSSPTKVASAWWSLVGSDEYWASIGHAVEAVLVGWAIASAAGIVVGALIASSDAARRYSEASIELLRAVPAIVIVPVVVVILGYSIKMEIIVAAGGSIWPVIISTADGLRASGSQRRDVAEILGFGRVQYLYSIAIPGAGHQILAGVRIALGLSFVMVVVAELAGNPAGIGYTVVQEAQALRQPEMYASLLSVGVLAIAANGLLALATSRVSFLHVERPA